MISRIQDESARAEKENSKDVADIRNAVAVVQPDELGPRTTSITPRQARISSYFAIVGCVRFDAKSVS